MIHIYNISLPNSEKAQQIFDLLKGKSLPYSDKRMLGLPPIHVYDRGVSTVQPVGSFGTLNHLATGNRFRKPAVCKMPSIYTYAFLTISQDDLELPEGIGGSLHLVASGQLGAVVEPNLDVATLQQSDDRLIQAVLHHDQVLRELFDQTPILPLRFGTQFLSEAALADYLHHHQADYQSKLTALAGKAEYTLKAIQQELPPPSIPTETKGKEYFLAKKRLYQVQLEQQAQQQQEFVQLQDTIAQTYTPVITSDAQNDNIERLYLLIDRQSEPELLTHLQSWRSLCPGWQLELSEALPPYHFV